MNGINANNTEVIRNLTTTLEGMGGTGLAHPRRNENNTIKLPQMNKTYVD